MTGRELVQQTLRFEVPRRCPFYAWVDKVMVPALQDHYGQERFIQSPGGPWTLADSATGFTEVFAHTVEDTGDRFVDEFGVAFKRGAIPHIEKPVLPEPSLAGYTFPDLTTDAHFAYLDEWAKMHADRFRIVQLGQLFFERTWYLRGMEDFFTDLVLNPGFVEELLDHLEQICLAVIDRLLSEFGDRIDAIGFSEDYGTQRGLMISPKHWRQFIKPRIGRMFERIRAGGKKVYIHSCGHVEPVIGDLIEIGVNMLQPIQPEAMDIFKIKREFGKDICLVGGISTQKTLPFGSARDVRDEVRACLDRMAAGGGYIMAPAKAILAGVPIENAIALIDEFVGQ